MSTSRLVFVTMWITVAVVAQDCRHAGVAGGGHLTKPKCVLQPKLTGKGLADRRRSGQTWA